MNIIEVKNLSKTFSISGFFSTGITVRALKNVSLAVEKGKNLGILGESGSGKTTLAKIICKLIARDEGGVFIDGQSIDDYTHKTLAGKVQMVFQDPFDSLNPKLTVAVHLKEAFRTAGRHRDKIENVEEILNLVGLSGDFLQRFPHQLSGGQRQRIAIARAIAPMPEVIIADEPVSALDISVQTQILNLFKKLQNELDITFVFISHDILATAYLSDDIIVMKDGEIIESGKTCDIISAPQNEYTKKLIGTVTAASLT